MSAENHKSKFGGGGKYVKVGLNIFRK